jgi:hypothetical protein
VVREEAPAGGRAGRGPLAVSRVVNGAGDARLAREEAEDGHRKRRAENKYKWVSTRCVSTHVISSVIKNDEFTRRMTTNLFMESHFNKERNA